jgi:N-acetylglutamate synthase-like GNAT family acetyltransferase
LFTLQQASQADFPSIRNLIHEVGINPTGLDWRRFLVARDAKGNVIGCGQVKPHRDGSSELASIAVKPGWRGQGIARAIIQELIAFHPGALYLTCRASLVSFYMKFGFRVIEKDEMPNYFQRVKGLVDFLDRVGLVGEELLVMRLDQPD